MTAKEKAKELFCNMYGCELDEDLENIYIINSDGYFLAKECALTAIEEILNIINKDLNYQNVYVYFIEVKEELENL